MHNIPYDCRTKTRRKPNRRGPTATGYGLQRLALLPTCRVRLSTSTRSATFFCPHTPGQRPPFLSFLYTRSATFPFSPPRVGVASLVPRGPLSVNRPLPVVLQVARKVSVVAKRHIHRGLPHAVGQFQMPPRECTIPAPQLPKHLAHQLQVSFRHY